MALKINGDIQIQDTGKTLKDLVNMFYPVGSVYISTVNKNPKDLFGIGTWTQISGKFLYCTNNSKQTGGKSSYKLTAAIGAYNNNSACIGYVIDGQSAYQSSTKGVYIVLGNKNLSFSNYNHGTPVTEHDSTNRDVTIMPPYFTVYCWYRTA